MVACMELATDSGEDELELSNMPEIGSITAATDTDNFTLQTYWGWDVYTSILASTMKAHHTSIGCMLAEGGEVAQIIEAALLFYRKF